MRLWLIRAALALLAALSTLGMEISGYLVTAPGARPEAAWVVLHTVVGLLFPVCAVLAWRVARSAGAGNLMLAIGFLWIPQTVYAVIGGAGALWPLVHSVDLAWAVLAGVLVLVYPLGRLHGGFDVTVVAVALVATVIRAGVVLLTAQPGAVPCACAPNLFALGEAPTLYSVVDVGYRLVGVLLLLVIAGRLLVRWVRGSVPARTVAFVMPVALVAWAAALAVEGLGYAFGLTTPPFVGYLSLVAMALVPLSYVAGLMHVRTMRARVADLVSITRDSADRSFWEQSLARTLRDPALCVFWWDDETGVYLDSEGGPAPPGLGGGPEDGVREDGARSGRDGSLLPVMSPDGAPIALIRHDRALTDNTRLLDGVSSALRLAIDNNRLRAEVERTLEQVRESRQRLVVASDEARRRIERDLHDGSQQQLVGLAVQLRLLSSRAAAEGHPQLVDELERSLDVLAGALRELRELAHGIHPSVLSEGGLALAIPELAARCPIPAQVAVEVPGRLPQLVESTVYYVVSEALANAAKHSSAHRCWVQIELDGDLIDASVRDNGRGGADAAEGSGIAGIIDRVEAVGGTLVLFSPPGHGTTLRARIPLR